MTTVWTVDAEHPAPGDLAEAARLLALGHLVAFPTETVYGLGANALSAEAIDRLYAAKGRPRANPLIVHVADPESARNLCAIWTDSAERLAQAFWPGPLTLVLPHGGKVPPGVTAGGHTVALRVPAHPVAQTLLRAAGIPVAAPSANPSGRISPTLPEHVLQGLEGKIAGLVSAGPCECGVESTVIDLSGPHPVLLRPGPLAPEEIAQVLGIPTEKLLISAALVTDGPEKSPGRMGRHYAPKAQVVCVATPEEAQAWCDQWTRQGKRHAWLALDPGPGSILLPATPAGALHSIYKILHKIDDESIDYIVAVLPPAEGRWLAFRVRLLRASLSQ
ncbi:MAG: L-threonylcarbamoyladenylate synthase [Gemmataceae bacterium]